MSPRMHHGTNFAYRAPMVASMGVTTRQFADHAARFNAPRVACGIQSVRRSHTGWHWLLIALAAGCLGTGCEGDECTLNAVRCVENAAEVCKSSAGSPFTEWVSTPCRQGYCHLSNNAREPEPFCSISTDPDPRCATDYDSGFCVGDTSHGCHQGFVESWINCKTGDSFDPLHQQSSNTGYCGSDGTWAQCVLEPQPNLACQSSAELNGDACSGNQLLTCTHGYVKSIEQCPASGACAAGPSPFCSIAKAADPDCPPGPSSDFCRDDAVHTCHSGWIVYEQACPAGTTCSANSGAYCAAK